MGLFSNLRGTAPTQAPSDAAARAVLTMPLLVAGADGNVDKAELDQIMNMCAFSPIFHAIGGERTSAIAREIADDRRTKGAEACFSTVKPAMTPKLAETAMCFAIRTAMADGNVSREELDMLVAMAGRLAMPVEKFRQIFDVMIMMQRRAA